MLPLPSQTYHQTNKIYQTERFDAFPTQKKSFPFKKFKSFLTKACVYTEVGLAGSRLLAIRLGNVYEKRLVKHEVPVTFWLRLFCPHHLCHKDVFRLITGKCVCVTGPGLRAATGIFSACKSLNTHKGVHVCVFYFLLFSSI